MTNETIAAPEQTSKPADGKSELNAGLAMRNKKLHELLSKTITLWMEDADPEECVAFIKEAQSVLCANVLAMDDKTVMELGG